MSKKRIVYDVNERGIEALDQLKDQCNLSTRTALIEEALEVFAWVVDEISEGRAIYSLDKNGRGTDKQLISTVFHKIEKHKKREKKDTPPISHASRKLAET
jgi:hypothetical protein